MLEAAIHTGLYVEVAAVTAVTIVAFATLLRGRASAPARWLCAALGFGMLGVLGLVVVDLTKPHPVSDVSAGGAFANACFVLLPVCIYRFGREFHQEPRALDRSVWGVAITLVAASLLLPIVGFMTKPQEWWHTALQVAIGIEAVALTGIVAVSLWRDARDVGSPVVRGRMNLLSAAMWLVVLAYVLSAIHTTINEALLGYVVALSALLLLTSFATPRALRARWRRGLETRIDDVVLRLMGAVERQQVTDEALPMLVDACGAHRVTMRARDGAVLAVSSTGGVRRTSAPRAPETRMELELPFGSLEIEIDAYSPLFGDDEKHIVRRLGAYAGLALERCEMLAESRRVASHLEELDRVKDALMTAASHDVRTPLTTMVGFANTLRDQGGEMDPQTREQALGLMADAAARLEQVLDELLGHAREHRDAGGVDAKPVDLLELANRIVRAVELRHATVTASGASVRAMCDSTLVGRIIENLVVNADRHAGESPMVLVTIEEAGGVARIVVDDDGPGVPQELREKIFEPEERGIASDSVPGSGLGLAIVRRFADVQGGRVWVEDSPQGGARFIVTLPLADA